MPVIHAILFIHHLLKFLIKPGVKLARKFAERRAPSTSQTGSTPDPNAARRRLDKWAEQTANLPLSSVSGIMVADAIGDIFSEDDANSTFTLTLEPWRINGEELQTKPLKLIKAAPYHEIESLRRLAPYSIINVVARIKAAPTESVSAGLLVDFLGLAQFDSQLNAVALRLREQGAASGQASVDTADAQI